MAPIELSNLPGVVDCGVCLYDHCFCICQFHSQTGHEGGHSVPALEHRLERVCRVIYQFVQTRHVCAKLRKKVVKDYIVSTKNAVAWSQVWAKLLREKTARMF